MSRYGVTPEPLRTPSLRIAKDLVSADSSPDHVRLTPLLAPPELKRRTAIVGPRHFKDAGRPLDALNAQTFPEPSAALEILHRLSNRLFEGSTSTWVQTLVIPVEPR